MDGRDCSGGGSQMFILARCGQCESQWLIADWNPDMPASWSDDLDVLPTRCPDMFVHA